MCEAVGVKKNPGMCHSAKESSWLRCGAGSSSFGTSRSSTCAAASAPGRTLASHLDELKISRALLRRATDDPRALADMRSLVELARDYRLISVAVGIEDGAMRDLARTLGCELGQGYFVSRPLVPDRLGPWRRWVAGVALTGSLTLTTFAGIGKAAASGGGRQTPTLGKGVLPTACSLDLATVAAS